MPKKKTIEMNKKDETVKNSNKEQTKARKIEKL